MSELPSPQGEGSFLVFPSLWDFAVLGLSLSRIFTVWVSDRLRAKSFTRSDSGTPPSQYAPPWQRSAS